MNEQQFFSLHHGLIKTKYGMILEYRLEIAQRIGRYLTPEEIVHHHYNINGSVTYVICDSKSYHQILHRRGLALRYCGNANWRKCTFCKEYDDIKNMTITKRGASYHQKCCNNYGSRIY